MALQDRDTIFALSSGRPPAAIAVVRVSGPGAGAATEALIGKIPEPRHATLATVREPVSREPIDQAVVLWFPAPASETGEDVAELQLHGGRAVIAAALAALARLPSLRPAEAGEFTRRAFENGRMDLTAVEGLADLIGAETEAQRRQAVRQLRGLLGKRAESWRTKLIEVLALVEAGLDFSDEGDVPADLLAPALAAAGVLRDEIAAALADSRRGERLREGLTIAVAGPPNAGKSTLFNWLAGREAAIVSPYPGTTRDVLEVHLDLAGHPVTVLDTAGVRDSDDPVEQEGIRRARARAGEADLVLWVVEAHEGMRQNLPLPGKDRFAAGDPGWDRPEPSSGALYPPTSRFEGEVNQAPVSETGTNTWLVLNKADLLDAATLGGEAIDRSGQNTYIVSALQGSGLAGLLSDLESYAAEAFSGAESALVTRVRHRHTLEEALRSLERALNQDSNYQDLMAEELRVAARALGRLTGRIDVEDVLDAIFRDFCIGK